MCTANDGTDLLWPFPVSQIGRYLRIWLTGYLITRQERKHDEKSGSTHHEKKVTPP